MPDDEIQDVDTQEKIDVEELKADILYKFNTSDSWRGEFEKEDIERYKLFLGMLDKEKIVPGKSNLFIPRTYEIIDTYRARLMKSFLSTRPYIDFVPSPRRGSTIQRMMECEEKAELASAILDMQLDLNGFTELWWEASTCFLTMPYAIIATGWRNETNVTTKVVETPKIMLNPFDGTPLIDDDTLEPIVQVDVSEEQVEEIVYDDNEISLVDYFDFWYDPTGKSLDTCRWVFHRNLMTWDEIENLLKQYEEAGHGEVFPIDREDCIRSLNHLDLGKRIVDDGDSTRNVSDMLRTAEDKMQMFEVLHYWTDTEHAVLINRETLAYYGENFFRHGKKPFVRFAADITLSSFRGMPLTQVLEHMQHELNSIRNLRMDNVALSVNRAVIVPDRDDIDDEEFNLFPGKVIHASDPNSIKPWEIPDVTASSYNEENILKTDMDNSVGATSVVRGANPQNSETATEIVTKNDNASIRFDARIMLYEAMGLRPLAYQMDKNNQQFMSDTRIVKLFGKEGADQWREVLPDDIMGEWDYRPAGSNTDPSANKEMRRQQLLQLYSIAKDNAFIDIGVLTKELLQTFDFRNPDKFFRDPLSQQALTPEAILAASQGAGQGAGGQVIPGVNPSQQLNQSMEGVVPAGEEVR